MAYLLHKELTGIIIRVYYTVYNGTGRTYPEFIYERAMTYDLRREDVRCLRQETYDVFYKGKKVGEQRLDLFIAGEVVVEIKVVPALTKLHKAQAFSYLKTVNKQVGLLCNFGGATPEFQRLYFNPRPAQTSPSANDLHQFEQLTDLLSPELTGAVIAGLYQVHTLLGPGFIHRIYANATYHELSLQGLDVLARPEYQVIYRGRSMGEIKFNHLQVNNTLMVFPVAVTDINKLSINNLKTWMQTQKIPIGILANFYPTQLEFMVLRV